MCTNPIQLHKKSPVDGRVYSQVVPCGKCPECLNSKQNDNAVLSYLEACKRGKLVFATLTYNNDSFPMMERSGVKRGENIEWTSRRFLGGSRLVEMRKIYVSKACEDFSKVLRSEPLVDSSGNTLVFECAPSLCRNDFRNYLKLARVAYQRHEGRALPEFTYMAVGEYGEQHHRPHMHVCFYGLEEEDVRKLLDGWTERYGYIDVKTVQRFTSDPSHDGFFAASRYLGKYLTKGDSDSFNVTCGLSEKSRVLRSIGFGIPDKRTLTSLLSFSVWKIMQDIHS